MRAELVDRFVNQAGEIGVARSRINDELRTLRRSLLELTENVIRLRSQLREVEIQAEVQMQSRIAHAGTQAGDFDPLELDRYTRLQERFEDQEQRLNSLRRFFVNSDDVSREEFDGFAQPLLLRVAASVVLPLALVFTIYIFMRGHNLPGGGFIAGLITAVALVLQFMSMGQAKAESLLRGQAGRRFVKWIGAGLGIAGLTGVGAFVWGRPFLTSAHGHPHVPLLGDLPLASAALFDLGVYLVVVGATLLTISVLGTVSRETSAPVQPSRSAT